MPNNQFKEVPVNALKFSAPCEFSAHAANTPRRFSGIAYSGDPITGHWYWDNVIFDLSTTTSAQKIPALVNHSPREIAGFADNIEINQNIVVSGDLSRSTDFGEYVEKLLDEGFPWQMSVSIDPGSIERLEVGTTVAVNGIDFNGPGHIFRNSKLSEVSFVPCGADDQTSVNAMSQNNDQNINIEFTGVEPMPTKKDDFDFERKTLNDEILDLKTKFSNEKKRADDQTIALDLAVSELTKFKSEKRAGEIKKLFSSIGKDVTDENVKPYLSMDETTFSSLVSDFSNIKPLQLPENAFSHTATDGKEPTAKEDQAIVDLLVAAK